MSVFDRLNTTLKDLRARELARAFREAVTIYGRQSPQANEAMRQCAIYCEAHGLPIQ